MLNFRVAAAALLVLIPAPALAGTASGSLGVSATVTASCSVSTTPVAFGNVDILAGSAIDNSGALSVTCTNGTNWTATAGLGNGSGANFTTRRMTAGSDLLDYNLYTSAARVTVWGDGTSSTGTLTGTGTGSAQNVAVYGRIAASQTTAAIGDYADTVAVTISY
jgi:spore coat protein U-like protein